MRDLFQSEEYLSFIDRLFLPFLFTTHRGEREVGRIQGYIQKDGGAIKQFLSRRAIVNGGPYLADDISDEELTYLLTQCTRRLKRDAIYIETRNFRDYSRFKYVFERCGFVYEPQYDFIVNTETPEIAEANLGKSRKRDIRTSLRDGASIVEDPSEELIKAFYSVLKELYEIKVKTPLFPLEFFLNLYHTDFSKFLLVRYQDEIIGGTVCVFDDETVYEWFA